MGGDDLGSDDEFLTGQVVDEHDKFDFDRHDKKKRSVLEISTVAVLDDDEDDNGETNATKKKQKRKKTSAADDNNDDKPVLASSNKKTNDGTGISSRHKLLLTAGRGIEEESTENQSSFLWTALVHYAQIKSGKDDKDPETDDISSLQPKLQPFHFVPGVSGNTGESNTFETRLRKCLPSMKVLKTWKHRHSPLALIICSSARRAVQVLKEIKGFKVKAAKLFAKHLTVEEQTTWLQETAFGIAVGTPHRLNVLCRRNKALKLTHTKLVILDAHADPKGFTVCTLPDTASDCMEFLREQVLPVLKERPKQLKLAFC